MIQSSFHSSFSPVGHGCEKGCPDREALQSTESTALKQTQTVLKVRPGTGKMNWVLHKNNIKRMGQASFSKLEWVVHRFYVLAWVTLLQAMSLWRSYLFMKDCSSRVEHPLPNHLSPTHDWKIGRDMERWWKKLNMQRKNNASRPNPTVKQPWSTTGKQQRDWVLYL